MQLRATRAARPTRCGPSGPCVSSTAAWFIGPLVVEARSWRGPERGVGPVRRRSDHRRRDGPGPGTPPVAAPEDRWRPWPAGSPAAVDGPGCAPAPIRPGGGWHRRSVAVLRASRALHSERRSVPNCLGGRPRRAARPDRTAGAPGGSGRQLVPTLGAPAPDDRPTGAGRHALPEPVALGPTPVVGLIRALHFVPPRPPGLPGPWASTIVGAARGGARRPTKLRRGRSSGQQRAARADLGVVRIEHRADLAPMNPL